MSKGVPTLRELDGRARDLRLQHARGLASRFAAEAHVHTAALASSPFANLVADFPHKNAPAVLAFNLMLVERVVEELISTESDPVQLAFTAARVAELGVQELIDPTKVEAGPLLHLAAAKRAGYFFTPPAVALLMARKALTGKTEVLSALDPAAGTGSLLAGR